MVTSYNNLRYLSSVKIIALMGFDGTGKTTTLRLVEKELVRQGVTVRAVPGFEHLVLDKFKKFFGGDKKQGQYDAGVKNGQSGLLFKLWPLLVFVECWLTFIYFKFFRSEKIIIFDRYFYDWLISFEKLGYSSTLTRFLFSNCLPRPDLGLIFVAEPEIAYQRKKNNHLDSLAEYKKQFTRYQDLARRKKFSIIDTSQASAEQVASQVSDLVSEKL